LILPPSEARKWIDPKSTPDDLKALLGPLPAKEMEAVQVGRWVNDPKHEDRKCMEAV